jgi:hypothetical protein
MSICANEISSDDILKYYKEPDVQKKLLNKVPESLDPQEYAVIRTEQIDEVING